jgi:hypothetical protein
MKFSNIDEPMVVFVYPKFDSLEDIKNVNFLQEIKLVLEKLLL